MSASIVDEAKAFIGDLVERGGCLCSRTLSINSLCEWMEKFKGRVTLGQLSE
jgi:hypothetical protein